tara:strand:+ start:8668 stop:9912 length:1245 start_codon:yes stop_codon:yes gene_type:complete
MAKFNWSKGLQTAGAGVKESGMLLGGLMYQAEQKAEDRLASSQAAQLTAAQKAYLESYKNASGLYSTLIGHRYKPITSGSSDVVADALAGEDANLTMPGHDWTELDNAIDKAWEDVERARKDYFRSVGVEYKYKSAPTPSDQEFPHRDKLGFTLEQMVDIGTAPLRDSQGGVNFGMTGLIDRAVGSPGEGDQFGVRAGDLVDVQGLIKAINSSRVEKAASMVEGNLTKEDIEKAKLGGAERARVEAALREELIALQKETYPGRRYHDIKEWGNKPMPNTEDLSYDPQSKYSGAKAKERSEEAAGIDRGIPYTPNPRFNFPTPTVSNEEANAAIAEDESWITDWANTRKDRIQSYDINNLGYDEALSQFASIISNLLSRFPQDVALQKFSEMTSGANTAAVQRAAQDALAQQGLL